MYFKKGYYQRCIDVYTDVERNRCMNIRKTVFINIQYIDANRSDIITIHIINI